MLQHPTRASFLILLFADESIFIDEREPCLELLAQDSHIGVPSPANGTLVKERQYLSLHIVQETIVMWPRLMDFRILGNVA